MKTANIATMGTLYRKSNQNTLLLLKYLPHITIVAVLVAILLVASQSGTSIQVSNPSLTHLGQH